MDLKFEVTNKQAEKKEHEKKEKEKKDKDLVKRQHALQGLLKVIKQIDNKNADTETVTGGKFKVTHDETGVWVQWKKGSNRIDWFVVVVLGKDGGLTFATNENGIERSFESSAKVIDRFTDWLTDFEIAW
jgi:uncharacterized protein YcaQ